MTWADLHPIDKATTEMTTSAFICMSFPANTFDTSTVPARETPAAFPRPFIRSTSKRPPSEPAAASCSPAPRPPQRLAWRGASASPPTLRRWHPTGSRQLSPPGQTAGAKPAPTIAPAIATAVLASSTMLDLRCSPFCRERGSRAHGSQLGPPPRLLPWRSGSRAAAPTALSACRPSTASLNAASSARLAVTSYFTRGSIVTTSASGTNLRP